MKSSINIGNKSVRSGRGRFWETWLGSSPNRVLAAAGIFTQQ